MAAYNATHDPISINLSKTEFEHINDNLWIVASVMEFIKNQKHELYFDDAMTTLILRLSNDASERLITAYWKAEEKSKA